MPAKGFFLQTSFISAMEKMVERIPESGCWIWTGSPSQKYPHLKIRGETIKAHIASYRHFHGVLPDGMLVCHKCDVTCCVNPGHLFAGTPKDNLDDMYRKGRQRPIMGEQINTAKLTKEQVLEIRATAGTLTDIAAQYGVSFQLVGLIRQRKVWKHV